jgi:spore germination cell wall hydrolase CwlJ-like protein
MNMKNKQVLSGRSAWLARGLVALLCFGAFGVASRLWGDMPSNQYPKPRLESAVYVQPQNNQNSGKPEEKDYKTNDFSTDSDEVLLARMIFGEGRNCSNEEKTAIAFTAINRANDGKKWNGNNVREAVLKPWQYSCFNKGDPNREKLMDPTKYDIKSWQECLRVAEGSLDGKYANPTNGATHYYAKGSRKPKWAYASNMTDIPEPQGYKHDFYKEN